MKVLQSLASPKTKEAGRTVANNWENKTPEEKVTWVAENKLHIIRAATRRVLNNNTDIEDAVQELLLRLWKKRELLNKIDEDGLNAYLRKAAQNTALSFSRLSPGRTKKRGADFQRLTQEGILLRLATPSPWKDIDISESLDHIARKAQLSLRPKEQRVFEQMRKHGPRNNVNPPEELGIKQSTYISHKTKLLNELHQFKD